MIKYIFFNLLFCLTYCKWLIFPGSRLLSYDKLESNKNKLTLKWSKKTIPFPTSVEINTSLYHIHTDINGVTSHFYFDGNSIYRHLDRFMPKPDGILNNMNYLIELADGTSVTCNNNIITVKFTLVYCECEISCNIKYNKSKAIHKAAFNDKGTRIDSTSINLIFGANTITTYFSNLFSNEFVLEIIDKC